MTDDTLSWRSIEPGWRVLASDGSALGAVQSVLAADQEDIFRGVLVRRGLIGGDDFEVLSERIDRITDGELHTSLGPEAAAPA